MQALRIWQRLLLRECRGESTDCRHESHRSPPLCRRTSLPRRKEVANGRGSHSTIWSRVSESVPASFTPDSGGRAWNVPSRAPWLTTPELEAAQARISPEAHTAALPSCRIADSARETNSCQVRGSICLQERISGARLSKPDRLRDSRLRAGDPVVSDDALLAFLGLCAIEDDLLARFRKQDVK